MKIAINLLLVALIAFLAYLLVNSITEPIKFQAAKTARQDAVVNRLKEIRTAQEIYREITGKFAGSFDSLSYVLTNDSIPFENIIGDPDDPENMDKVIRTITYSAAIDTIRAMDINLDSLRFIPYAGGEKFDISADTITYESALAHVVQVGTRWKTFMGRFGDKAFAKYDSRYDPDNLLKFGDMSKPNLTGNWE